eukprot:RCo035949
MILDADGVANKEEELKAMAEDLKAGVKLANRRFRLRLYKDCMVGSDAVTWLVNHGYAATREEAVTLGREMAAMGHLRHVTSQYIFKDEYLFYTFNTPLESEHREPDSTVAELHAIAERMRRELETKDRKWRNGEYVNCFTGTNAVDWLVYRCYAVTREAAVQVGRRIQELGWFSHVVHRYPFRDAQFFYRWAAHPPGSVQLHSSPSFKRGSSGRHRCSFTTEDSSP